MAADSSAGSYGLGAVMPDTVQEQPVNSPLCAAAPSQTSAPEVSVQENAIIPDAGNSRSTGSSDSYDSANLAIDEDVNFETRTIGEASTDMDTQSLKDQGVTVEYGVSSPVALLPGEAAVCTRDDGSLSLYYRYNDEDTLRLTKEGRGRRNALLLCATSLARRLIPFDGRVLRHLDAPDRFTGAGIFVRGSYFVAPKTSALFSRHVAKVVFNPIWIGARCLRICYNKGRLV